MRPASVPFSMASASSSRSAVTNLSPAFSAIFSAVSNTRASSGARYNCPAAAARNLGPLGKRRLDRAQRLAGVAAGALDQARRQAFRVVEQHLEQMLGCELLVALAQGEALGRLHEALGPIGIAFEVHCLSLLGTAVHAQLARGKRRQTIRISLAAARPRRHPRARPATLI